MKKDTGFTIFGMPVIESDDFPKIEKPGIVFYPPPIRASQLHGVTKTLVDYVGKYAIDHGRPPDKLELTQDQMKALIAEIEPYVAGWMNKTPEDAPSQPMFMGIPIEIKQ